MTPSTKKTSKTAAKSTAKVAEKTAARTKSASPAKTAPNQARPKPRKPNDDVPNLFRINVEVGDLDKAARFYSELFGTQGRGQAGSRVYFTAGAVTLQVVDVSSVGKPHPAAKALYFTVKDLDALHARAKRLDALSKERVHGEAGGAITVRPWGERSFYAEDPWKNPLCFVEAGTIYPG
jgi:predicted enzyme related to lactoylglutathione lyase